MHNEMQYIITLMKDYDKAITFIIKFVIYLKCTLLEENMCRLLVVYIDL